ncbi:hypothetical protein NKR23_g2752 [Pleurostoma richardsiae]|uniref:Methyltransferase domain-containing protein n=1 Tax=Pleurostoma richardsiae TaxID=41990 RepID=A0AA38S9D1_9PEZI|nr:hypothetical protein NKR23_g2752 [Pleurostoma richardsiae]
MATSLLGNPKRVITLLWLVAALMFTIAVLHSLSPGSTEGWVSDKVHKLAGSGSGSGAPGAADRGLSRSSMHEHLRLAEASWAKTVRQRHEMIEKDYGHVRGMPLFPSVDATSYRQHPYTIWDFTPASFGCPHEIERVGRMGDGGKWVCGMSRYETLPKERPCIVYSFGVWEESSFENELLSRTHCEIFAYDFSVVDFGVQLEPDNRARAHFMQAGIAGKTNESQTPPFYSIADLMKKNGHDYIDILKMDIEFAEFEALDGLGEDFPANRALGLPIGQLMVEIHFFNGQTSEGYLNWWERLEARGMRPTWTEPNLLAVTLNLAGDKSPTLAEYTLLNIHDKRSVIFGGVTAGDI